jgi:glycosyltransferase involved in cell wall biosynthesis
VGLTPIDRYVTVARINFLEVFIHTAKLLVFTATYNEADNIRQLVKEIKQQLPQAHLLVVDDHSTDGTREILEEISLNDLSIQVINRPRKLGLGTAHKLAMKRAIADGYDFFISMDADFSHHPKYLPKIFSILEKNDFVIGSRYCKGGKCDYGFARQVLSRTANALSRLLLGIKLHETTTSFRGYNKALLSKLPIDSIKSNGYSFFIESLFYVSQITAEMEELPIHFEDRRSGTTKINKKEISRGVTSLFRLFFLRVFKRTALSHSLSFVHKAAEQPCGICKSHFQSEIYPATQGDRMSAHYTCTSTIHHSHGRITQCLLCGLVQTNPRPNDADLINMYSDVEDTVYIQYLDARVKTFAYNFKNILSFLPKTGRLLDIGSYCGVFLDFAKKQGYQVQGIEPSRWAAEFSKSTFGTDVTTGTIEALPKNIGTFDIVTAWDVLEHFSDPLKEIKAINSRMMCGNKFVFCTLDYENWVPRVLGKKWPWLMDMHLYYFTGNSINDLLTKTGFKLLHRQKYCHIITLDYFLIKLDSLGVPFTMFFRKLLRHTSLKNSYVPFRFGDIQMYVCEKVNDAIPKKKTVPIQMSSHSDNLWGSMG